MNTLYPNNPQLNSKIIVDLFNNPSANKFYLIDSQDAVYGNETYDLASLVDDVRLKLSLANREKIYNSFIINNKFSIITRFYE